MKTENKFKPIKEKKERNVLTLALPKEVAEDLDKLAAREKISKNSLVRQMIEHCLKDVEEK